MRRLRPAAGLLLAWVALGCGGPGRTDLYTVRRDDLPVTVEASGSLRAAENTTISPPPIRGVWRFQIAMIADESSGVKKGQPILAFDASDLQQELERKTAERDQAAKELEKRRLDLEARDLELDQQLAQARAKLRRGRMKVDVPADLTKRIELESARLEVAAAESEVESLEAQRRSAEESGRAQIETLQRRRERAARRVEQIQEALGKMTVTAPRDGLVIQVENWRGEKKKVGDTVSRWDEILQIPDLSRMEALAEIDEVDAGRVRVGQRVTLRLEAHPDDEHAGRVASIEPTVRRQSWRSPVKVYRVLLALDETDPEKMRPGMRFRAEVEVDRLAEALIIPLDAVLPRDGAPAVLVRRGGALEELPVELGVRNREMVEVHGGLSEGDRIVRRGSLPGDGSS